MLGGAGGALVGQAIGGNTKSTVIGAASGALLGAVVGGLLVGVVENLVGTYVPWIGPDLKIVVALILIFGTLLIKPDGLFGQKKVARL